GLLAAAGCRSAPSLSAPAARAPAGASAVAIAGEVASNIVRGDYAGSRACAPCHGEIYERFLAAPMHRMTRLPAETQIEAPFSGEFRFKDDRVRFEAMGGERFMRIESAQNGSRRFRVTKVIGGHYREDFAGVEVDDGGRTVGDARNERVLPASYFLGSR